MDIPFGHVMLMQVEPGTVVEQDGMELEVTDEQAVRKGNQIFCTPKVYAAIKAKAAEVENG